MKANTKAVDKNDIREPIEGAIIYLDKVNLYKDSIPNHLIKEDYQKAWEKFDDMLDGLDTLNQLLINIKNLLSINYENLYIQNRTKTITEVINEFNLFLNKIVEGMENKDYLLVSDLIEFEFGEYIELYKSVFESLLDFVKEN